MALIIQLLKKLPKRVTCRAHAESSDARCTKPAFWGTRYCWQHESKLYVWIALGISVLSGCWSAFLKDRIAPGTELKELRAMRDQLNRAPALQLFVSDEMYESSSLRVLLYSNATVMVPMRPGATNVQIQFVLQNVGRDAAEGIQLYYFCDERQKLSHPGWQKYLATTTHGLMPGFTFRTNEPVYFPEHCFTTPLAFEVPSNTVLTTHGGVQFRARNASSVGFPLTFIFFPSRTNTHLFLGTNDEWKAYLP